MYPSLYMCSLDIESLFTNLPLKETTDICTNNIFRQSPIVNGLHERDFRELLNVSTQNAFFMFNDDHYEQINGVSMGSSLGPSLANAFLCHYETSWLKECPVGIKPTLSRRYVDDIFCLFKDRARSEKFLLHEFPP